VEEHDLAPPTQVLDLFSGGYGPRVLLRDDGSDRFPSIDLVDIWMGIGTNSHVYTSFGANNPAVSDYLAGTLRLAESDIGSRFGHGHPHEHEHRGRQHAPLASTP
jgi:hypothetical protein